VSKDYAAVRRKALAATELKVKGKRVPQDGEKSRQKPCYLKLSAEQKRGKKIRKRTLCYIKKHYEYTKSAAKDHSNIGCTEIARTNLPKIYSLHF
jgi:hypothetical protein